MNLPNSAVTGTGSLSTVKAAQRQDVPTPVVVGLKGDSRTQIVSGLNAGAQVVVTVSLPALGAARPPRHGVRRNLGGGPAGGFGGGGLAAAAGSAEAAAFGRQGARRLMDTPLRSSSSRRP